MVVLSFKVIQTITARNSVTSQRRQSKFSRSLNTIRCGIAEPSGKPAPVGQKTKYNDGFFEKAFMTLFAWKMENFAVNKKKNKGWFDYDYESFVDVSKRVMIGRSRMQQQEVLREVLMSMLPPGAPEQFRKLFPPTKWAGEFNAALTVPFFHWLVGPSEVIEVEIDGIKQISGVRIQKCRYLENSGCVGMCVNMCKIPTQDFFTNEFGLPLTMIPSSMANPSTQSVINYKIDRITYILKLDADSVLNHFCPFKTQVTVVLLKNVYSILSP